MKDIENIWLVTSINQNWKPSDVAFIESVYFLEGCDSSCIFSNKK